MVRKMGLEPTRHRHTHLKRACLPIPALPQIAFDCKKDSSTFGGIKSSPILYLFSCAIKRPLLSFITVILARKPFAGAVFAPTAHIWLCVGGRRGRHPGNYAHLAGGYGIRPYVLGQVLPCGYRRGAFYMLPWQWAGDVVVYVAAPKLWGATTKTPLCKG